jgi:hypothetical protein
MYVAKKYVSVSVKNRPINVDSHKHSDNQYNLYIFFYLSLDPVCLVKDSNDDLHHPSLENASIGWQLRNYDYYTNFYLDNRYVFPSITCNFFSNSSDL